MLTKLFDRANFTLYPGYLSDECLTKDIEQIFGKKIDKVILEFRKSHVYYFANADQYNEFGGFLLEKIIADKSFYLLIEQKILDLSKRLIQFCDGFKSINILLLSDKDLFEIYLNYTKNLKSLRAWGWVPPLIDGALVPFLSNYIQEKLRSFLTNLSEENNSTKYYSILSSTDKISEGQQELIARLNLITQFDKSVIDLIKNKSSEDFINELNDLTILNLIKDHVTKFGWLTYGYTGPTMSETFLIELIKDCLLDKKSIEEQIEYVTNRPKIIRKEKEKIIKELSLPEELVYLFDVSSFFMYIKDMRKSIYQKSYVAMDPILNEIAKRINISLTEIRYLVTDEIKQALLEGQDFTKLVSHRTDYCVALIQNGKTKVFQGDEAKKIKEREVQEEKINFDVSTLKGSVAYVGKVTGLVKIVSVVEDLPKMNEGDVLVSSSTNPDLIIGMKKASAFVTDMGGITSHAAIVARELKKPCIVGTKFATRFFKDGDLVEVDAIKGIVKLLKRKS